MCVCVCGGGGGGGGEGRRERRKKGEQLTCHHVALDKCTKACLGRLIPHPPHRHSHHLPPSHLLHPSSLQEVVAFV